MPAEKIVLVAASDETYRKPLLESEGYRVIVEPTLQSARAAVAQEFVDLVLIVNTEKPAELVDFCEEVKSASPRTRTALIARLAEHIPSDGCFDSVIQLHHSPGKFLAAIRTLIDSTGLS